MNGKIDISKLKEKEAALQLRLDELIKLLGGTAEDRKRYWEIVLGITTPAEFKLVEHALDSAVHQLAIAKDSLAGVLSAARAR